MNVFTDVAMPFVWRFENDGQPFHDDPRDPGGATSWGVTFRTWRGWCERHGTTTDLETFKALPRETFLPLYRMDFYQAVRGDELSPGVALMMFDVAVGSSPLRAIQFLQVVLGTTMDGLFGPKTLAATKKYASPTLISGLWRNRRDFYSRSPNFPIYGRGWDRRADDCEKLALSLETNVKVPTP